MPSYSEIGEVLGISRQAAKKAADPNCAHTPLGMRVRALLAGQPDPDPPHWREIRLRAAGLTIRRVCELIRARGPTDRPDIRARDRARGQTYRPDRLRRLLAGDVPDAASEAAIAATEAVTGLDMRTPPTKQ